MSSYLNEDDSDDDIPKIINNTTVYTEGDIIDAKEKVSINKSIGDDAFRNKDYIKSLEGYTNAINILKSVNLPQDSIILSNRSAVYLALKRYVPACHDAIQSSNIDPTNWKGKK